MATKVRSLRGLRSWIVRATSSLPVPLAPVISTEAVLGATISMSRKISCILRDAPLKRPSDPASRSLRRVASSSARVPSNAEALVRIVRRRFVSMGFVM